MCAVGFPFIRNRDERAPAVSNARVWRKESLIHRFGSEARSRAERMYREWKLAENKAN